MLVLGSYNVHRQFSSLISTERKEARNEEKAPALIPVHIVEEHSKADLTVFSGLTLLLINNISTKLKHQMFNLTLFMQSRGLSKTGRQVLSSLGFCSSQSSFYREREIECRYAEETCKYVNIFNILNIE